MDIYLRYRYIFTDIYIYIYTKDVLFLNGKQNTFNQIVNYRININK